MIPVLSSDADLDPIVSKYLSRLLSSDSFKGDVCSDYATRLIHATDNSVYQVLPAAVLFPRSAADVQAIFHLVQSDLRFQSIAFTPRGGGTGTNGQALTPGVVIDCSKHMNHILELNLEEGWVLVEAGVVLDQLNEYLKPYDVFFAPTLSPSNRATLGGMVSTDACGKGSRLYGKTSDHVLEISAVYVDGSVHSSRAVDVSTLRRMKALPGQVGEAYSQVDDTVSQYRGTIEQVFPKLKRSMTGYDLAHVYSPDRKVFNLNSILCGSEGTLATVTQVKLRLTPLPKCKCLLVSRYVSFEAALQDAVELAKLKPSAIETMDETVLSLSTEDCIYQKVKDFLGDSSVAAINLTEFVADSEVALKQQMALIQKKRKQQAEDLVSDEVDIDHLWQLRKKSVGLLANKRGDRQPTSGIEDTVVPPEVLPEYVRDLRALLEEHQLEYGMFGHIDVGCLHVRPAFDMTDPKDERLYYQLTDQVAKLTQKYGGLMWGEHGKGYRSHYVPMFFGETLYPELQKIKASFDPNNQLNPGKIATTPSASDDMISLEGPTKGQFDRQVPSSLKSDHRNVFRCNGNGACFNYDQKDFMCPSYKVTGDRLHSPKGRAALMREWLRLLSLSKKRSKLSKVSSSKNDFSRAVYDSMQGCLGCKACQTECPVHVNVPDFKSKFLEQYHTRYPRPLSDYFVARSEQWLQLQQKLPRFFNVLFQSSWAQRFFEKRIGMVDLPRLAYPNLRRSLKQKKIPLAKFSDLSRLTADQKKRAVLLVQDVLTSAYEPELLLRCCEFIRRLGWQVYILPAFVNGKALHVKGFLKKFKKQACKNIKMLEKFASLGIDLVGVDPSFSLVYRDEYSKLIAKTPLSFHVHLLQEWLMDSSKQSAFKKPTLKSPTREYVLLSHCTEKTLVSDSDQLWQAVFSAFGLSLRLAKTGCCGMAGSYGHEAIHREHSQQLFAMSWLDYLPDSDKDPEMLVTGYSCRSQVSRFAGLKPKHPVELLYSLLV